MTEDEYDDLVAPLLLQAASKAEELGGTVLCYAEYGPERDVGRTVTMKDASAHARMVELAIRCKGNLDAFVIALLRAHNKGELDLSATVFLGAFRHDHSPPEKTSPEPSQDILG